MEGAIQCTLNHSVRVDFTRSADVILVISWCPLDKVFALAT